MSRSGYSEDYDGYDGWQLIMYRGAVASAIKGQRGQALLKEMLEALDALPEKQLIAHELEKKGAFCAIGTVGAKRGIDMSKLDPDDPETVAGTFGCAVALAREIVWINDEAGSCKETPEERFARVRRWVAASIKSST